MEGIEEASSAFIEEALLASSCLAEQQQEEEASNPTLALNPKQEKRNPTPNPKTTRGRQKIEIKQINEEKRRQVAFSKRRRGLFKKSAELSVLCGAQIAVITFSRCGRIYTFCSSNLENLMENYLKGKPVRLVGHSDNSRAEKAVVEEEDGLWLWKWPVERVPEEELEEYLSLMRVLKDNLLMRIQQVDNLMVERVEVPGIPTVENADYWKQEIKNPNEENQEPANLTVPNDQGDDGNRDMNFSRGFVNELLAQSEY